MVKNYEIFSVQFNPPPVTSFLLIANNPYQTLLKHPQAGVFS